MLVACIIYKEEDEGIILNKSIQVNSYSLNLKLIKTPKL